MTPSLMLDPLYMGQTLRKPHIRMSVFGRKWFTKNNRYIFCKLIRKLAKTTERMQTLIPHMHCNFGQPSTSYTKHIAFHPFHLQQYIR